MGRVRVCLQPPSVGVELGLTRILWSVSCGFSSLVRKALFSVRPMHWIRASTCSRCTQFVSPPLWKRDPRGTVVSGHTSRNADQKPSAPSPIATAGGRRPRPQVPQHARPTLVALPVAVPPAPPAPSTRPLGWAPGCRAGRAHGGVVLAMIKRRAAVAGLPLSTCCYTFRATGDPRARAAGSRGTRRRRRRSSTTGRRTRVTVDEIEGRVHGVGARGAGGPTRRTAITRNP